MNRRSFLVGACSGLATVSGCLDFDSSTSFATDKIEVRERGCGDKQNTVAHTYDTSTDQLHLKGILSGTTQCGDLGISYAYSDPSDRIFVEVIVSDAEGCSSCTRYYDYKATVSFRETPRTVVLVHSDPEPLEGWALELDEKTSATDTNRA